MTISTGSVILASDINALPTNSTPVGTIIMFAGSSAPSNYLACNGSAVSRSTYSALFAVISTTYGSGDGSTTFNVPNYQGVVPKGTGSQTINTRSKTGPDLGVIEEDQTQGHYHNIIFNNGAVGGVATMLSGNASASAYESNVVVKAPVTDGTNGTPRTGATTRENSIGTNFYIRYQ